MFVLQLPFSFAIDVLDADPSIQISFRYHQMAVSQWNFSKGYGTHRSNFHPFIPLTSCPFIDNTTPIGPCLVAAHVIPDPQKIPLKTTVNGKVVQDGTTASVSSSLPSDGTLTP